MEFRKENHMSDSAPRLVDAHVHHWDPERTDWYPFFASENGLSQIGIKNAERMRRRFDQATYLNETGRWSVDKYVHVTGAVGPVALVAETKVRQREAEETGRPNALIGSISGEDSVSDVIGLIDQLSANSRFRGVRAVGAIDYSSSDSRSILGELQDRNLLFELLIRPPDMRTAARALETFDALRVVVEHLGWPISEGPEDVKQWREGMTLLAESSERAHCKLSGLAMTLHRFDVEAFRPWIDHCLSVFGAQRCFFASNFPVDGLYGSFESLFDVYDQLTSDFSAESRDRLFAQNAENLYRC